MNAGRTSRSLQEAVLPSPPSCRGLAPVPTPPRGTFCVSERPTPLTAQTDGQLSSPGPAGMGRAKAACLCPSQSPGPATSGLQPIPAGPSFPPAQPAPQTSTCDSEDAEPAVSEVLLLVRKGIVLGQGAIH